jgi:hypothetical protein
VVGLEDASKGIDAKDYKQPGQDSLNQHANLLVLTSQMQERLWGQIEHNTSENDARCFVSAAGSKIGSYGGGPEVAGARRFQPPSPHNLSAGL